MLDDAVGTKFEKILLFDKLQPQRAYLKRFMVEFAAAETVCGSVALCLEPATRNRGYDTRFAPHCEFQMFLLM